MGKRSVSGRPESVTRKVPDLAAQGFRDLIATRVSAALQPIPGVLAGWEGGSAAFGAVDAYSDIDLTYLVDDNASLESLYAAAEKALESVSPIVASHRPARGRYYSLRDGGEFFLVDLIFVRVGDDEDFLDPERHGRIIPLFDKKDWLQPKPRNAAALDIKRDRRFRELQTWFPMSQIFVRKAILRGQHVEALNAYWICTLKPLAELLRMRHCPVRWDFGVRYLEQDLPTDICDRLRELAFVTDDEDLQTKFDISTGWGLALLQELASGMGNERPATSGQKNLKTNREGRI